MPLKLEGRTLAARIAGDAARRIAGLAERLDRPPTLAAVAVDEGRPETLYFDVKRQVFEEAGAEFRACVLPRDTTTGTLADTIRMLNRDPGVDGIYVQYPLPEGIDAQAAFDVIDPLKDVDGASSLQPAPPHFFPATAVAVVALLSFHDVPIEGRAVAIVRGDALFAELLATLVARAGGLPTIIPLDPLRPNAIDSRLAAFDIVVAATGCVDGVNGAMFRDGAVAVDVGYYHGGGRGDIAVTSADLERMAAYASPRGSIGPLTVALLVSQTAEAASRALDRQVVH